MECAILLVMISASATLSLDGSRALSCSAHCPPPWLAFQDHCYLWVDTPLPWAEAESYCRLSSTRKAAHLASIYSETEDEFIKEYVGKASGLSSIPGYWIGFNDLEREGNFTWTGGSDATYEGWQPNEPNQQGDEDCVERFKFHYGWNDFVCTSAIRFVCKM